MSAPRSRHEPHFVPHVLPLLQFVKQLVRQNNLVIAGVRNPSEALELRTFLTAFSRPGKEHRLLQLDLTDEGSIRAFAESLSPMHVDVLINNAGEWMLRLVSFVSFLL